MLKIATVCTGIGSPEMALANLEIPHEIVFGCEIDKYARNSYVANFQPNLMLEDMTKQTWEGEEFYADLFIGGIPCQAFSLAGKRLGELNPRGLLFYDFYRYVKVQQPKYFIIENVKGLLSMNKGEVFQNWKMLLGKSENGNMFLHNHEDSLLYNLHWQVQNTKKFGLPQNRERVFLVGIRNDLPNDFVFPKGFPLTNRLKDVLETNVDEKYYLSDKMIAGFIRHAERHAEKGNGFKFEPKDPESIANTITTTEGSRGYNNFIDVNKLGFINQDTQASQVFSSEGVSPTITAGTHGYALGYIQEPQIGRSIGRNPDNPKSRQAGLQTEQMFEINRDGLANTLTSVQKDNLVIEPKVIQGYRIRRLTPKECFRLQGYSDEFFEKCQEVNSDTQLYKQAGNTISVPVIQSILERLIK